MAAILSQPQYVKIPGHDGTHHKILTPPGIFWWMRPANDRWRYIVTASLIGWRIHKMIPTAADSSISAT